MKVLQLGDRVTGYGQLGTITWIDSTWVHVTWDNGTSAKWTKRDFLGVENITVIGKSPFHNGERVKWVKKAT